MCYPKGGSMGVLLQRALKKAEKLKDVSHLFHKPDEYIWDRIQRERAEGNYKYLGGNYKLWIPAPTKYSKLMSLKGRNILTYG